MLLANFRGRILVRGEEMRAPTCANLRQLEPLDPEPSRLLYFRCDKGVHSLSEDSFLDSPLLRDRISSFHIREQKTLPLFLRKYIERLEKRTYCTFETIFPDFWWARSLRRPYLETCATSAWKTLEWRILRWKRNETRYHGNRLVRFELDLS